MNRRLEQRFQVYTPVKLTLLDQPEQPELDCLLVDISGAGMKLVADVELPEDQMISMEAGQHVVLAEVRHCSARGSKFAIGVEKVHVMPAASLDQHASKVARLQALVDNYRLRIQEGIKATLWRPDVLVSMKPEPQDVPEAVPQSPTSPEVVVGGSTETTLKQPKPQTEGPPPQPADPIRAALETLQKVEPVRSRPAAKMIAAAVGLVLLAALLIAPIRGRVFSFTHVIAVAKTTQPEAPNEREPSSQTGGMTGMAESVKLPAESITAVQVDPKSAAELLNSTSLKSAPAVATSPAPPAVAGGALGKGHASLKFTEPSWASVCADGQKVFGRLLPAGEVREITFSEKAVVRLGNAGGVEIALDGKPVGSLGQPGQLRLLELTSTGWRQLPTGDPADDCAKDRGN